MAATVSRRSRLHHDIQRDIQRGNDASKPLQHDTMLMRYRHELQNTATACLPSSRIVYRQRTRHYLSFILSTPEQRRRARSMAAEMIR